MSDPAQLDQLFDALPDSWWAEYERQLQQNRLKRENPYVVGLIKALAPHPRGLHRSWVIDAMEKDRKAKGLDIPPKFEAAVQSAYNQHSSDSSVWKGKGAVEAEALFYAPEGKGSGKWALQRERAVRWLKVRMGQSA